MNFKTGKNIETEDIILAMSILVHLVVIVMIFQERLAEKVLMVLYTE